MAVITLCSIGSFHATSAGASNGDSSLGLVADECGHLVAVLLQFGEDVRSDEPGCTGECDFHDLSASCGVRGNLTEK